MSPRLPNELLGAVSNCLHDNLDWITIQTMSLVSPDLQLMCQKLLYKTLSFTVVTDGTAAIGDRLDGLAKTPRLISYVRSFRLELKEPTDRDRAAWVIKHSDLFVQVLKLLTLGQIEALCLVEWQRFYLKSPRESESPQLKELRDSIREALQLLLETPFIRTLSVTHRHMGSYQTCTPSLKHLVVHGTIGQNIAVLGLSSRSLTPTIALETFESHNNVCNVARYMGPSFLSIHQYLLHPGSPFSLRSLKRLVWKNDDKWLGDLRLVMESCARSLQHLDLHIAPLALNHDAGNDPPTACIWAQEQLENLAIHAYIHTMAVDVVPWLYHELGCRKTPYERLDTISITLSVMYQLQWSEFVPQSVDETWHPLGEALADPEMFPSLQSVRLHICCPGWIQMGGDDARKVVIQKKDQIRKAMLTLENRGILDVEISIEVH
ncbi:hypothetical protein BKA70DRAFT_549379 [Coprinopsis sp. MPI-PUGE-AT-0042]|nr:hypothetical protein BKA70DRAFT_549379 [Coprinopsis sp. MPI-PUGE-AT-0042]